jgi:hypothetical protein
VLVGDGSFAETMTLGDGARLGSGAAAVTSGVDVKAGAAEGLESTVEASAVIGAGASAIGVFSGEGGFAPRRVIRTVSDEPPIAIAETRTNK